MHYIVITKAENGYILECYDGIGKHSMVFTDFESLISYLRKYFGESEKEAS
jgi:hypothetical protein